MKFILQILGALVAVWVYRDSRSLGYGMIHSLMWCAGMIAFLPVFFPMYLLVGRKRQMNPVPRNVEAENASPRAKDETIEVDAEFVEEEKRPCPMCANMIPESAKNCPYCGFTTKMKCEVCGEELKREWKVCPNCQTEVPKK